MGKYDYRDLSNEKLREYLGELTEIFFRIKKKKDIEDFLSRLLTPSEQVMLARRIQVAGLLVNGLTYDQIQRHLGVGISTIRSIDSWLEHEVREYQNIRAEQRAAEHAKEQRKRKMRQSHHESTVFGTFADARRRDSRYILINLLLGR